MSLRRNFIAGVVALFTLPAFSQDCLQPEPQTLETAYTVAKRVTASGVEPVPPSCGDSLEIACENGQPVHSTYDITQHCLAVSGDPVAGFSFSGDIKIVTPQSIPATSFGMNCTLNLNTGRFGNRTAQVSAQIRFVRDTAIGGDGMPVNRIVVQNLSVSGIDAEDVAIGGDFGCQFADPGTWRQALSDNIAGVLEDRQNAYTVEQVCRECRPHFKNTLQCPAHDPKLLYTRLDQPCRIIDTRSAGGPLTHADSRSFRVTGTSGFESQGGNASGCGIPAGKATAALINFVAVNPSAAGNLRGAAYPNPIPSTGSIINYQAITPSLNVANALAFPICDPTDGYCHIADITVAANGGSTHLVADVVGYLRRVAEDDVKSFGTTHRVCGGASIGAACGNLAFTTVKAPVAGNVTVTANVVVSFTHGTGGNTGTKVIVASINSNATSCQTDAELGESGRIWLDASLPPGNYRRAVTVRRTFPVDAGTHTFYVNASGGSSATTLHDVGLSAVFHPD